MASPLGEKINNFSGEVYNEAIEYVDSTGHIDDLQKSGEMTAGSMGVFSLVALGTGVAIRNLGKIRNIIGEAKKGKNLDFASKNVALDRMNPRDIRFTQDTVSPNFSDGGTVTDAVRQLQRKQISPDDFPAIRVIEYNGTTYSLDNRRLTTFNAAGLDNIPVQRVSLDNPVIKAEFIKKFRPIENGQKIVVVPKAGRPEAKAILKDFGKYE